MSCRETASGSAFTSYARLVVANGTLSDPAVLSTFHELRRVYANRDETTRRTYTLADYQALLQRQINRVQNATNLSDAKRRSILARLARAQQEETPSQDILYALHNLTPTVRSRTHARSSFIRDMANRMGTSYSETEQRFNEYESRAVRSRSRTPEGYSEDNQQLASRYNLGRDVGIVTAVAGLVQEANELEIRRARSQPQRILPESVPLSEGRVPGTSLVVMSHGYDARDGRYQVAIYNEDTRETTEYAYHNVPDPNISNGLTIGQRWYDEIRGNEQYAYANEHEAATRGVAERCTNCGQFSNNRHECPVQVSPTLMSMNTTQSRWSRQRVSAESTTPIAYYNRSTGGWEAGIAPIETAVRLPAIRELRTSVQNNPVRITGISANFQTYGYTTEPDGTIRPDYRMPYVRGEVTVYRTEEGELQINTGNLNCSCQEYEENRYCQHQNIISQAIRERITPPPRTPRQARTPEERERLLREAQERAEQAAQTDWTRNEETLQEAQRTWREDAEILYSENPEGFAQDVELALTRAAAKNGEPDIPYMKEDVLDGYAKRGSGQAFGVELEFDLPPNISYTEKREAITRIAQELYDAGITYSNRQEGYGASRRRGFVDVHTDASGVGTWSFEYDGSVTGGELVTAAMYDESETWEKLEKAVEIIKRNGGIASRKAGAHVHVGTGTYRGDPKKYTELARIVAQHEDVLFRLASDTKRGTHRKNRYTGPANTAPVEDFADVSSARRWAGTRYTALNMQAVAGDDGDHPEFRLFDSSLDPGTIQSQIKLAVGMVNAADRIAATGGTQRSKEEWGAHKARQKARGTRRRMTPEEFAADTATTRSLLDTLFRRRNDKAQLAAVFAHTKWAAKTGR